MYRGAWYCESGGWEGRARCAALWRWVLRARIHYRTLLHSDTCDTAHALTCVLMDAWEGRGAGGWAEAGVEGEDMLGFDDVLEVFEMIREAFIESTALIRIRPVLRTQAISHERALRTLALLVRLLSVSASGRGAGQRAERAVARLVRGGAAGALTRDTLLHASLARNTQSYPWGALESVRLLISAGASCTAHNAVGSSPLHLACVGSTRAGHEAAIIRALMGGGAHLDQPNVHGDTPAGLLAACRSRSVDVMQHITLSCLAARALFTWIESRPAGGTGAAGGTGRAVLAALPRALREFVLLHATPEPAPPLY